MPITFSNRKYPRLLLHLDRLPCRNKQVSAICVFHFVLPSIGLIGEDSGIVRHMRLFATQKSIAMSRLILGGIAWTICAHVSGGGGGGAGFSHALKWYPLTHPITAANIKKLKFLSASMIPPQLNMAASSHHSTT